MNFDPMVWTHFSSGKLLIVRQSELDKLMERQAATRDLTLLAPWADTLARHEMHRQLNNIEPMGEA